MTLEEIRLAERAWRAPVPGVRPGEFSWNPYDIDDFRYLLTVAMRYAPNRRFLDAGCGIGTKCLIAASLGLAAEGAERVPAYIDRARGWGITVHEADLLEWDGYAGYGIVYLNHPLHREDREAQFEQQLGDRLAAGTVLVKVNTNWPPPSGKWQTVLHERRIFRGIWVKR